MDFKRKLKIMKKMLFCLIVFFTISCSPTFIETDSSVKENIRYFKDKDTNLCFATITSGSSLNSVSITCVPCDSLKRVIIY